MQRLAHAVCGEVLICDKSPSGLPAISPQKGGENLRQPPAPIEPQRSDRVSPSPCGGPKDGRDPWLAPVRFEARSFLHAKPSHPRTEKLVPYASGQITAPHPSPSGRYPHRYAQTRHQSSIHPQASGRYASRSPHKPYPTSASPAVSAQLRMSSWWIPRRR